MKRKQKAIILAGGNGSRLHPVTQAVTKQLLPVYDKPLIYYPLSIVMMMGITDILMVVKEQDLPLYKRLLGDGLQLGISLSYVIQETPRGLPDAFILGRDFIGGDPVTMILGDNIFYGSGLIPFFKRCLDQHEGATAYAYRVNDPQRFGVVSYTADGQKIISLEEKPKDPKSDYAISGFYHFDSDVTKRAAALSPSARGELEIMDLLGSYLKEDRLKIHRMSRGFAWLDTGTSESLLAASQYVQILEERQGIKVACLEEIAFMNRYIDRRQLIELANKMGQSAYGEYLHKIARMDDE